MQDNTNNSNEFNANTGEGNPLASTPQMTPEDIYQASMADQNRFVGSYYTAMRNSALREQDTDIRTGTKALRDYTKRLEDFQSAYEKGDFDEKEVFDLVRKNAKAHATGDRFFYETFHEGAWDQARSMTSDEHTMFLGTDMRARNQYLHDSSEASELAGMLGLGNTDYFRNKMKERGIDTSQEGDWTDTFTSLFSLKDNALFNYENLIDDIGRRKDPEWTTDSRDNAWARMLMTETGQDIVRATGMTREALDSLPNQDSLIYVMNRKWKEAKFAQHASEDAYGGMVETFGQMLPSIVSDPDTIGELSIAAVLALPSAGTSLGAYAAAKVGSTGLAKGALTLHRAAKAGSKVSKLLPSRVLGDFVVPGVRAGKAGNKAGITGWDNMRFAWNQMDEYENWPTFLAGASVNGFVGGAGAFAYNASRVDALNDQVYGKGAMPSVMTFDNLTFRGMMGVGGAIVVGSGIRTTMQVAGAGIAKQISNPKFRDILGLDKNKVARLYEGGLIERAIEKGGGESSPGTVEVVAARIERQSSVVGADKRDVTLSVAEKLGRVEEDITDADISTAVREAVAEQAQTPRAREARAVREERLTKYKSSAELESTRVEADHSAELNRLQSSAIVRAGRVEMNEAAIEAKVNDGADARADDADLDAVLEAREAADKLNIDNAIKSTESRKAKTESKKSEAQRQEELTRKQEAADKAAAKRQARIDEANRAAQEATETQSQREAEVKQIEATEEKVGLAEAIRLVEQAKQRASEAVESAESASKAPEVDRPTEISDVSKKDAKAARKASAEVSREALSAKQTAERLTEQLAKKWGVDSDEIESVIAEAVSWRRTRAARQHLANMLEAMEAEGLDGVPEAVFRHMVKGLNPKWANSWDGNDGDLIDFETAKGLANEAARKQQAQNFTDLLDSQDALAISNALTRGSYGELKEMLDKLAEEGPGQAVNAAAKMKLLTGGGNLRDLDFKGDGIYLKDQAYMEAAIKNVKDIEDSLTALEVKVDGSPRDYIDRIPEMNNKEMVFELVNTHGFASTQEFNKVSNQEIKELLGYMRWLADVQNKIESGEINGDVLIGLGLDNGAQALYLTRSLAMVEGEIIRLKENGSLPHMSEVEMYRLLPAYYSDSTLGAGRSGVGTNLRDGMLHGARVTAGGDQYDLIQVRNILSQRLASVDADYNRARTAAAQAELKKLEEAVETDSADLDSRIRLNVYRNRNKVVNEIDFVEKEILTTYREIAMDKARARRDEMGDEAYRRYLDEETLAIQDGLMAAISRNPMSAERRTAFMNKYGISSSGRKPGEMSDKDWTNFLVGKLGEVAERELGFPLRDLINGKQAAVSGHHAGRAAYAALAWQRTITGDAANPMSTAGTRSRGTDVYHHVNFGVDRQANDMGNLSIRKQVDFINKHLLNETERQILFDAEGNPRVLSEDESKGIIDYYLRLKEMSAEEMAEVTPRLPFEQRYRQQTLTGRDMRVDEPLRGWTTIQQRVDRQLDKILRTPPVLIQGIHDDLTFAISMGTDGNTGLTSRAGFLNDTNEGAQGAGRAYGLGAGWQTVFAVPGSVADFLNTRSSMVFKQLEGMDEFARALGMRSLMEIRDVYAKQLTEGEDGMSSSDAKKASEVATLLDLDKAVRIVKNNMNTEEELLAFEAKDAENLQNAWDASSQAVSLAKGLFGAIRSKAGDEGFLPGDVLRDALSALGWSERDGLLNEDIRMFILSKEGTTAEMGKALAEADLAENAADFYSKVWDFMYDLPSGNPREANARGRMAGMFKEGTGPASHVAFEHGVSAGDLRAAANLWDSVFESIGKWGGKTEIKAEAKAAKAEAEAQGMDPAQYVPYQSAMMKGWMRDKLMKRPVMTRAYGAGGQAMREAVKDFLMEALTAKTVEAQMFRDMLIKQDPASAEILIEQAKAGRRDGTTLVHAMGANLGWAFADVPPGSKAKGQGLRMGQALDMPTAPEFRDLMRGLASVHNDLFDPARTDLRIPGYEIDPGKLAIGDANFVPTRDITWDDVYSYRSVDETAAVGESAKDAEANTALSREALNQQARAVAVRRGWDKDAPEELLEVLGMWHIRNLLQVQAGNSTAKQMMKLEAAVFGDMQAIIDKGGPTMFRDLESFLQNWLVKPDTQILRGMNSVGLHPVKARYEQGLSNAGLTVDDVDPRSRYAMETGTALHTQVASSAGRQFNNAQGSKGYVDEETGTYIYHTNRGNSDEVQGAANDFGHGIMRGWDEMSPEERQRAALQMVAQDLMLDFAGVVNPPVKDFVEPTPQGWLRAVAENEGNAVNVLEDRALARAAWKANTEAKEGLGIDERADILQDDLRVQVGSHHGLTITQEVTPGDSSVDVGIPQLQLYKLQATSDAVAKRQLEAAAKGSVATSGIKLGELAVPATLKIAPEMAAIASVEGPHSPDMSMMDGFRMEQDPEWVFNFTAREVYEYAQGAGIKIKSPADLRRVWEEMQIERGLDDAFDEAVKWADKSTNKNDEFTLDTLAGRTQLGDAMWLAYNRYTESAFGQPLVPASKEHGHRSVQKLEDKGTAYPSENLVDGLAQTYLQGGNRENADAVFGPAHRAGLVLDGDHRVSSALMTGLMAKSVFHQDFAIGMGAAVEHYRFGMWFLKQKHPDMSSEDLALNFERLFAKRLEDKDEYNKLFQQWRDGDLDLGDGDIDSLPNSLSTFATLGAVRERLAEDPAAMELANKVFGIERPEDLTDDVLRDTLKVMEFGDGTRTPDAMLDSIGRSLTNDKVPTGTVLWRTMEQFRAAGVDPASQPLVRRLWLAAMLEREVDKLNLRDGMGAIQQRPLGYTLFGPKDQKVSSDRVDAARSTTAKVLGMKDGMDWSPSARPDGMGQSNALANIVKRRMNRTLQAAEDNGIVKKGTTKETIATEKEIAELEAKMITGGFGTDAAKAEAEARLAELKEKFIPLQAARVVNYQYIKFGGNKQAAEAMFESNDRAFKQNFGLKADIDAWDKAWTVLDKRYAEINEEVKESLTQDLIGALGKPDQANERAFSSEMANNIINASETARVVSPEAREAAKVQAEAVHDGTILSKGDPDAADSDPIFGEGRTLFNDFDDVVRAKRYPAIDKLVNTLVDNGVMDKAEARKLAAMLAMNGDVVGNLIDGIEFTYTGETGSSSAVSVVNSAAELESRIKLTSELKGMDAMGAFDIIAHEVGHVILHRAQAERTGKGGAHRSQSDRHIKTMLNDFRNRALKSAEFRQEVADTFVSMHGEERGNQMATNFLSSIMHEIKEGGTGRSDYSTAFNEFFAQMMSWHLLSRVDTLQIVTPFMKELGVLYRSGWGENIRRAVKLTDPDPKVLDPKGTARRSLERLAQIANHAAPAVWATGRAARFSGVEMFAPTRRDENHLRAKKDELVARLEADSTDMVAEVELRTVINQMRELQSGVFDETSFRDLILRQTEDPGDRFFYQAGLARGTADKKDGIGQLADEIKETGRAPDQADIGVVNPKNLIQQDRQLLEDAMLESLMSGRHDAWSDSTIRTFISKFGEGVALQDHSSAWNSMSAEVQLLGNLLNPGLSFQQMRNGTRIKPISLQQLDLYIASRMDPAMEMAVELAKVVSKRAKKDPTFGGLVNRAFEEAFKNAGKGGTPETPNLDELQTKDPNSANLAEQAGERFAKVYDDAYNSAYRAGQIDDWVHKSLLADRQLPLHLSEAFKNGNTMPTAAGDIASGIADNLLKRLKGSSGDGREHYLSADVMREFGILAPDHVKGGASVRGRAGHVEALDVNDATKGVVDGVIEYATLNGDDVVKKMVGDANRVDAYFYAADFMNSKIRKGELNSESLPPAVYKAYEAALTDPQAFPRDVYTDINNREYFQEKIDQDFPDPDDRRQMKSVMFNGPRRVDYLTYTAMKMLHKARHGGYSFADSQFISGEQFRTLIGSAATRNGEGELRYDGDPLHDVGLNMSPISIMGTFKPQFFSWTDKAMNQNLIGIQGYGVTDIFNVVRRRVNSGTIRSKDGTEHRLSPKEQETLLAAIESVETQARLAMGRRPKVDQDGAAIAVDAVTPLMASAMNLMTVPNWTAASLVTEGTAGIARRVTDWVKGKTDFGSFSYFKNKSEMRDELHAIGLALPYQMASIGFSHMMHYGLDEAAAMDLDPTVRKTGVDKFNEVTRTMGNFGFERVSLAQRHQMLAPSYEMFRRVSIADETGKSKLHKLSDEIDTWYKSADEDASLTMKDLKKLAKKTGVDQRIAWQLWQMDVFTDKYVLDRVSDFTQRYLHRNSPLNIGEMMNEVQARDHVLGMSPESARMGMSTRGQDVAGSRDMAAATAIQKTIHYLVTRTNLEPEAGTRVTAKNPLIRMWSQLTSFALAFMRNTLSATAGGGVGVAASLVIPMFMGETLWYTINRMKNGEDIRKISSEAAKDPSGFLMKAFLRMPILGAGSVLTEPAISAFMGMINKSGLTGDQLSTFAEERTYGMSSPGMPGVSMFLQALGNINDSVRNVAGAKDLNTAMSEAKDIAYTMAPVDFRPIWVAALRQITEDFKEQESKHSSERARSFRPASAAGIMREAPARNKIADYDQFAEDFANMQAESVIRSSAPQKAQNSSRGVTTPPAATNAAGTAQGESSGLSGPKRPTTGGDFGPGSASGPLADRY